jgi:hypothetical protein
MFEQSDSIEVKNGIKKSTLFMLKSLIAEKHTPVKAEDKRNVMLSAVSDFNHVMDPDVAKRMFGPAKKAVEKYGVEAKIVRASMASPDVTGFYLGININDLTRLIKERKKSNV